MNHLEPRRHMYPDEVDELLALSGSQNSADGSTGPCRRRKLSSNGFRFKCDERAEKRKEFYSKLREKKHGEEAERNALLEKTKEIQEAEIKMLRKMSIFKANPLPSFYYEVTPPEMKLKKIPPTRARSPKFSSRRRSTNGSSNSKGESSICSGGVSRTSQDQRIIRGIDRRSSPRLFKKQLRKSHPKLPDQQCSFADAKECALHDYVHRVGAVGTT